MYRTAGAAACATAAVFLWAAPAHSGGDRRATQLDGVRQINTKPQVGIGEVADVGISGRAGASGSAVGNLATHHGNGEGSERTLAVDQENYGNQTGRSSVHDLDARSVSSDAFASGNVADTQERKRVIVRQKNCCTVQSADAQAADVNARARIESRADSRGNTSSVSGASQIDVRQKNEGSQRARSYAGNADAGSAHSAATAVGNESVSVSGAGSSP